jgi:hypothetical protein
VAVLLERYHLTLGVMAQTQYFLLLHLLVGVVALLVAQLIEKEQMVDRAAAQVAQVDHLLVLEIHPLRVHLKVITVELLALATVLALVEAVLMR